MKNNWHYITIVLLMAAFVIFATLPLLYPQAPPPCLLAGTKILTKNEVLVNIENIKAGDEVFGFDEKTFQTKLMKVTEVFKHENKSGYYRIFLENGEQLEITGNHPVYTASNIYTRADNLKANYALFTKCGLMKIVEIKFIPESTVVYNLEVSDTHNYFANGILVHNKVPPPPPPPPPIGGGIPLPAPGGGSNTQPGSGQGGPAQGNNSPPVPIEWKVKYASALERVNDEKMPILIFFTTEEFKSLPDKLKLPSTNDLVKDIGYLMITLVTDTKDKDKDNLNIIKKILKAKESSKNKDKTDKKNDDKKQTNNDPPKEEIEIAVKYQVTSVPQLVWCDCYGNELQKGNIQIISTNSSTLLKREAKLVLEKQKELKSNLETQYKDLCKRIEDEKKKGELSAGLIQKLRNIAQYDGYEPSQKARRIIEENNK